MIPTLSLIGVFIAISIDKVTKHRYNYLPLTAIVLLLVFVGSVILLKN